MKLDNKNLEVYCLASVTKSFKCMESLLSKNITDEHFEFQADGDIISFTDDSACKSNEIFQIILQKFSTIPWKGFIKDLIKQF